MTPAGNEPAMNAKEETLSPSSIKRGLKTRLIGRNISFYPRLTSTMDAARQEALRGAPEGTTIIADEQSGGKGREKRAWLSPAGSIALSVVLYPELRHLPSLIMVASLAVVRSIAATTGLKPQIKWPNDIMLGNKKVCGILIENELRGNIVNYAVIGIGINANFRIADFPEITPIATSLSDEMGKAVSRLRIVRHLLSELENLYLSLPSGDSVYQEWKGNLATLGRRVRVKMGDTAYDGIAGSVERDGALLLLQPDGNLLRVVAGDITLRDL